MDVKLRGRETSWANGVLQNNDDLGQAQSLLPYPQPSPYYWPSTASLVEIYFSSQPSAGKIIKVGGHNFCQEGNEHSLAKITRALQGTCNVKHLGRSVCELWPLVCLEDLQKQLWIVLRFFAKRGKAARISYDFRFWSIFFCGFGWFFLRFCGFL